MDMDAWIGSAHRRANPFSSAWARMRELGRQLRAEFVRDWPVVVAGAKDVVGIATALPRETWDVVRKSLWALILGVGLCLALVSLATTLCTVVYPGGINTARTVLDVPVVVGNDVLGVIKDGADVLGSGFNAIGSGLQHVPEVGGAVAPVFYTVADDIEDVPIPHLTDVELYGSWVSDLIYPHSCSGYDTPFGYAWKVIQRIITPHLQPVLGGGGVSVLWARVALSIAFAILTCIAFFAVFGTRKRFRAELLILNIAVRAVAKFPSGEDKGGVVVQAQRLVRHERDRVLLAAALAAALVAGPGIYVVVARPSEVSGGALGWLVDTNPNVWCFVENAYYFAKFILYMFVAVFVCTHFTRAVGLATAFGFRVLTLAWRLLLRPLAKYVVFHTLILGALYTLLWFLENVILWMWLWRRCRHKRKD